MDGKKGDSIFFSDFEANSFLNNEISNGKRLIIDALNIFSLQF